MLKMNFIRIEREERFDFHRWNIPMRRLFSLRNKNELNWKIDINLFEKNMRKWFIWIEIKW